MTVPHSFALVTGASSGIGAAFARVLPDHTHLLLTGRDGERLGALAAELSGGTRIVEPFVADLTKAEDREALIARAGEVEIDLLINNAGLGQFGAVLDNDPHGEVDTVEVNCAAPVDLAVNLLPEMISRARMRGGRAGLINVSSTFAVQPVPYVATYSASKAFVLSWTEALAEELRGKPIDVLALCPGATRTDMARRAGFSRDLPFRADPEAVAREGLTALGRETVHVCGHVSRAALAPYFAPRRLAAGGLGLMMGVASRLSRRG
jgi:hypothetical protein